MSYFFFCGCCKGISFDLEDVCAVDEFTVGSSTTSIEILRMSFLNSSNKGAEQDIVLFICTHRSSLNDVFSGNFVLYISLK
jgi:hypothetical protein